MQSYLGNKFKLLTGTVPQSHSSGTQNMQSRIRKGIHDFFLKTYILISQFWDYDLETYVFLLVNLCYCAPIVLLLNKIIQIQKNKKKNKSSPKQTACLLMKLLFACWEKSPIVMPHLNSSQHFVMSPRCTYFVLYQHCYCLISNQQTVHKKKKRDTTYHMWIFCYFGN